MQKTCIVIPCFNESFRLNFEKFKTFLDAENTVDFLFINDGSTDNTFSLLKEFQEALPQRISLLNMPQNSGKAEAVRCGILEVCRNKNYEYAGFWDADLSTPLSEIPKLLYQISNKQIAMGSRVKRLGATIDRKLSRHIFGRLFATFSSIILKIPVYDTQCGAKLFRCDLSVLFVEKFLTSWLFDIELLARYRNKFGVKNILNDVVEVPLTVWIEKGDSKLKFKHLLKVPFELIAIYLKYN